MYKNQNVFENKSSSEAARAALQVQGMLLAANFKLPTTTYAASTSSSEAEQKRTLPCDLPAVSSFDGEKDLIERAWNDATGQEGDLNLVPDEVVDEVLSNMEIPETFAQEWVRPISPVLAQKKRKSPTTSDGSSKKGKGKSIKKSRPSKKSSILENMLLRPVTQGVKENKVMVLEDILVVPPKYETISPANEDDIIPCSQAEEISFMEKVKTFLPANRKMLEQLQDSIIERRKEKEIGLKKINAAREQIAKLTSEVAALEAKHITDDLQISKQEAELEKIQRKCRFFTKLCGEITNNE